MLVADWPAFDLPEHRVTLDGDAVSAAACLTRQIWPDKASLSSGVQPQWTVGF